MFEEFLNTYFPLRTGADTGLSGDILNNAYAFATNAFATEKERADALKSKDNSTAYNRWRNAWQHINPRELENARKSESENQQKFYGLLVRLYNGTLDDVRTIEPADVQNFEW